MSFGVASASALERCLNSGEALGNGVELSQNVVFGDLDVTGEVLLCGLEAGRHEALGDGTGEKRHEADADEHEPDGQDLAGRGERTRREGPPFKVLRDLGHPYDPAASARSLER